MAPSVPRGLVVLLAAAGAGASVSTRLRLVGSKEAVGGVNKPASSPPSASKASRASSALGCSASLPRHSVKQGDEKDAVEYLDSIYDKYEESAYEIPRADAQKVKAAAEHAGKEMPIQCNEDAYGEIPQESAIKMFSHPLVGLRSNELFVDLGSGLGRLVIDAAVFASVHRALGVELSHTRHNASCQAVQEVSHAMPAIPGSGWRASRHNSKVEFLEADILKLDDELLHDAGVVYVASLCFRTELLAKVREKLDRCLPTGARIVSLKAFDPPRKGYKTRLHQKGTMDLPMSWSVPGYAQALYVYEAK